MRILAGLIVILTVLSGCFDTSSDSNEPASPPAPVVPANWPELALPHRSGHDHQDAAHHQNLSTPNFELVGWDPLITDYHGATSGTYYCGGLADASQRHLTVSISFQTDVAVVLADVTDRSAPAKVGEFVLTRTHVYDADIVPDGSFVALAASESSQEAPDSSAALNVAWRDACGRETSLVVDETPYQSGVILLDTSDPSQPELVDYVPQPGIGVHSIFATTIDGTHYILASTTNLVHQSSYFSIFTIASTPLGPRLQPYGVYESQYIGAGEGGSALVNGHVDGWIQKHPLTGDLLAYLANWDGGLIIVRLDGPGRLTTVGVWNDHEQEGAPDLAFSGATGQIHEAMPIDEVWDGRHYTFIGQEVGGPPPGRPTGQVIMLDTTDPAQPRPYARWTLPHDPQWDQAEAFLLFSTHYVDVLDRTLFVTLYHGGVWAVGTDPVNGTRELPTLGVFVPANVSPKPPPSNLEISRLTPEVLDVFATRTGELVTFDNLSGAYVLRFDPKMTIPIPEPWTEDAWID